eukprot:snap_masked-scaffold_7-processed-gene-4.24-mRNA-1 protein AED:0.26 eAED:0.26 QI:0/-1/0/1/-1/1/1/0/515
MVLSDTVQEHTDSCKNQDMQSSQESLISYVNQDNFLGGDTNHEEKLNHISSTEESNVLLEDELMKLRKRLALYEAPEDLTPFRFDIVGYNYVYKNKETSKLPSSVNYVSYVLYDIERTSADSPRITRESTSSKKAVHVSRRYSDFMILSQLLEEEFSDLLLPGLPSKTTLRTLDQHFIEIRLLKLNEYLRILLSIETRGSSYLKQFLYLSTEEWQETVTQKINVLNNKLLSNTETTIKNAAKIPVVKLKGWMHTANKGLSTSLNLNLNPNIIAVKDYFKGALSNSTPTNSTKPKIKEPKTPDKNGFMYSYNSFFDTEFSLSVQQNSSKAANKGLNRLQIYQGLSTSFSKKYRATSKKSSYFLKLRDAVEKLGLNMGTINNQTGPIMLNILTTFGTSFQVLSNCLLQYNKALSSERMSKSNLFLSTFQSELCLSGFPRFRHLIDNSLENQELSRENFASANQKGITQINKCKKTIELNLKDNLVGYIKAEISATKERLTSCRSLLEEIVNLEVDLG